VSCAKTSEPIDMQFEMLSRLGPRIITWHVDAHTGRGTFGVVLLVEKHGKA